MKKSQKKSCFTPKDYESTDGMLTRVWGPSLWHVLHCISFNYPVCPSQTEKRHYKTFVLSLQHVLPCRYCRENFPKNLKSSGFGDRVFKNRDTFSRWVYRFHNRINVMLHKKCFKTYDKVRDTYENFRARCSGTKKERPNRASRLTKSQLPNALGTRKKCVCVKPQRPKKEKGCTNPLYGVKSRCVLTIMPSEDCRLKESIKMDPRCKVRKNPSFSKKKS